MNNVSRTLAAMATFFNIATTPTTIAETTQEKEVAAKVTYDIRGEAHDTDYAEGDILLTPKVTAPVGDAQAKYTGIFRKATTSEGETTELQTITHNVSIKDDIWGLTIGRNYLRTFDDTTTTVGFDNYMSGKGLNRIFTGTFIEHLPTHLTLGIGSSDTTLSPSHWDMLIGSYSHHLCDILGIQAHTAITKDGDVEKAGLAIEYKPTSRVCLLADTVHSKTGTSAMLAGNFKATDNVKLFSAAEITKPSEDKATGKVIAGVEGNLGHGVKAIGAVQHDTSDNETMAILGLKFKGSNNLL